MISLNLCEALMISFSNFCYKTTPSNLLCSNKEQEEKDEAESEDHPEDDLTIF